MTDRHQHHLTQNEGRLADGFASASRPCLTLGQLFTRLTLAVITALALTATSASADVVGHRFERTIAGSGSNALTNPTDVAVDDSAGSSVGDLYVADPAKHRVEKFSPAGVFLLMFGDEVNATNHSDVCAATETCQTGTASSAPGGFQTPTFVAVDGSSSSSAGDVYVGDTGDHLISKFNPSDEIIASWASAGQLSFATISGLAVDRTGNLFVGTELKLFEDNANAVEVRNCELSSPASSDGLAVEGSDNIFELTAEGKVQTLSDECTDAQIEDAATNATGLAVNPAESGENDLYVDQGGTIIDHFVAGCTLPDCESADTFGSGHLSAARGIAIANSGTVYVADPGAAEVAVFPNHTLPDLSLAPPNTQLTSATLSGHVDPDSAHGGGEITACEFEYVDQSEFEAHEFSAAAKASCAPATPYAEPKEVTAHISALTKHTTYHYRLSATTEQGTSESPDHTFTTSPTNLFTSSFGAASSTLPNPYPLDEPNGVAIEEKTGDVYVIDAGNHRIEKFSPSGEFLLMFGAEVNATNHGNVCTAAESCQPGVTGTTPAAFQNPAFIAVDNSSGSSAGDVYVVDNGESNGTITKFDSTGHLVTSWGTGGRLHSPNTYAPALVGLGVDDGGNVWIAAAWPNENGDHASVYEFNSAGELLESFGDGYLAAFAVAPSGESYFANTLDNGGFGGLQHFSAGGDPLPGGRVPGSAPAVAFDGDLYTITGAEVTEFDPVGTPLGEPFGFAELKAPSGLAIGPNNDAYVADSGAGDVAVFADLGPVPTTGPSEEPNHTAITLTGEVDPRGRGEVTKCGFEYVTEEQFQAHEFSGAAIAPCSATHFSTPTAVTAHLVGLLAETTYRYRLAAGNEDLATPGAARAFTLVAVFGVETGASTEVKRTSATLNGSLNPDELPTHYSFEYVTADQFEASGYEGATSTPEAEISTGSAEQSVSYQLSGLLPQTTYHYRLVAKNEDGTTDGGDEELHTVPAVLEVKTGYPTGVLTESVVLHGSYVGDVEGGETSCYFQYGTDQTYGHNTSEPPGLTQGSAAGPHNLEAEVTGLSPRHTYHFSLVCRNQIGTTAGSDETFETRETPTVDGISSANLTKTSADLRAKINPQGSETKYYFEYGTTTAYGAEAPPNGAEIGEGSTDVSVEADLENLKPGFVYHFRLVATNQYGTTTTEDQSFNFYPPQCPNEELRQETNSSYLPDCRAYELVSPGDAGSAVLAPGNAPSASFAESPARFAYVGLLGQIPGSDSPNSKEDTYVATRTPTGWVTHYVGILGDEHEAAAILGESSRVSLLADLSLEKFVDFDSPTDPTVIRAPYAWNANGDSLGQWPQLEDDGYLTPGADSNVGIFQPSPDFAHLAITSNNVVFPTGEGVGQPAHQGQTVPPGSAYDYDTMTGRTSLISVTGNGQNLEQELSFQNPGNSTFEPYDFIELPNDYPENMGRGEPVPSGQAISTDGTHILMALPIRPPCVPGGCDIPNPVQLYIRVNDAITYEIAPGHLVEYVGMAAGGSKVYFTSEEHLTGEDEGHGGTSLFIWSQQGEEEGKPLILVSKGDANSGQGDSADCNATWIAKCGVEPVQTGSLFDESVPQNWTDNTIAEEDGDIYFYSPEQLDGARGITGQMNLYDYQNEKLQYVTSVEPSEECNVTISVCRNAPITRFQVSPSDSHAAFVTADQITSYNTEDPSGFCSFGRDAGVELPLNRHCQEMYSYDPSTGKIVCVSCNPSGAPPRNDVSASTQGLFMADDGRTFFSTKESLVETDTNGVEDVYEYTEGRPQLITTGTDAADLAGGSGAAGIVGGLAGVSADGVNAYFATRDTLVPQDDNGQYIKFYDARTDGGFPFEKQAPPCESADECHGTGSGPSNPLPTGTEVELTGGNTVSRGDHKHRRKIKRHRRRPPRSHHSQGGAR